MNFPFSICLTTPFLFYQCALLCHSPQKPFWYYPRQDVLKVIWCPLMVGVVYKLSVVFQMGYMSSYLRKCLTLCDPMDCSLPCSSIHGIFQARVLEWVSISFSRVSSQARDWTQVSCIVGRRFTIWATREVYLRKREKQIGSPKESY